MLSKLRKIESIKSYEQNIVTFFVNLEYDRIKFTIGSGLGLKRVTIGIAFNTGSGLRLNRVSRLDQVYDWFGFRIESSNHWNRVKYWIRFTVESRFTIRARFTIGSGLGLVPFFYSTSYHWNRVYD